MSLRRTCLYALLLLLVDAFVVQSIRSAPLSPWLLAQPFWILWGGGFLRAGVLLFLCGVWRGRPSWTSGFLGRQTIGVLCFHRPAYVSVLRGLGLSTSEELWGWHSWQCMLHGYGITAVAWLYWSRYVSLAFKKSKPENTDSTLKRLVHYMLPYTGRFVFVMLLVMLSSYGEMAVPQYTGHMTDWIMDKEKPDAFTQGITIMAIITITSAVLEFICDILYTVTMGRIHATVQGLIFQSVLRQEIAFFDATPTGDIVSHITTDTDNMSEGLSEELSLVMWYIARLVFILYFMFSQSWQISVLTCMGMPILWVIPELSGSFHQSISKKVQQCVARANQVATETFSNIKTVRSFANEDGENKRYEEQLDALFTLNKQEALAQGASTCANSTTTLALKVFILYYGGTLVMGGSVSSGDLVSFVLYELQFASAVNAVMHCYPRVKKAIGASEKIFEYVDRKPLIPPEGTLAPRDLKGHVEFKNITFTYPGKDTPVLVDVSLEMKPGKITALVGLNSAGMSTCVRLLEQFYQPQAGQILLDESPLQSYKNQYLHDKMSVVSQESVLFSRTIAENIKYGCEHATDDDMERAAKMAAIHVDIKGFPSGYQTDAGEKGGMLSGGQKQRIAIARALMRQPRVLVLDNATSDLDTETEYQVFKALLDDADGRRTVLLISHKMSAVERADHIVVLAEGRVVEEGAHCQLMQRGGHYAKMVDKYNQGFQRQEKGKVEKEEVKKK